MQFKTLLPAVTYYRIHSRPVVCLSSATQFLCEAVRVISSSDQIISFNNYMFAVGINDMKTFIAKYYEER